MADITKIYTQEVPAFRFIGKKYGDEDRVNGGFGAQWGQAFENGLFYWSSSPTKRCLKMPVPTSV